MATVIGLDGRPFRRVAPGPQYIANGWGQGAWGGPLWSDGTTAADYYGTGSAWRMASYAGIYRSQPIIASAVNKLYRQISTLPLKAYRKRADNDRERVIDGSLVSLLEKPTARKGIVDLLQWISFPLHVQGNSLLVKFREDPEGPPTELLPIDWPYVSAYAEQGLRVEWWETTQTGERRFFRAEDALHFAWESDGIVGISPIDQLGVSIKIEDAVQRHTISSFRNGVRPALALILHPDAKYDDETRLALRESAKTFHGTPDNSGGMFVAGGGADVKTLSYNAQEAELIKVREVSLRETCMVFDVKPPVLGDFTHATYSNVEEGNKDFYKTTLRPPLQLIQSIINTQLIDPEPEWQDLFVEFDLSEQLKGDPKERAEAQKIQLESGTLTVNEGRKQENRPRFDDPAADEPHIMANNLQPIGSQGNPDAPPPDLP